MSRREKILAMDIEGTEARNDYADKTISNLTKLESVVKM
jgi:hypothetical protein